MRSFIISGVRSRSAKTKSAIFQLMNQVQLVAYDKEGDGLARIKEISMDYHYTGIPFEILRSSIGVFILEVCRNAIQEKESNAALYDYLEETFRKLDKDKISFATYPIEFLISFSSIIGFSPMDNYSESKPYFHLMDGSFTGHHDGNYTLNEESSKYLHLLLSRNGQNLTIPKSVRLQLLNGMLTYYKLHMDSFRDLKSLAVLSAIL